MDSEVLSHKSRHKSFTQVQSYLNYQLEILMGLVIFNLLNLFKKKHGYIVCFYDARVLMFLGHLEAARHATLLMQSCHAPHAVIPQKGPKNLPRLFL